MTLQSLFSPLSLSLPPSPFPSHHFPLPSVPFFSTQSWHFLTFSQLITVQIIKRASACTTNEGLKAVRQPSAWLMTLAATLSDGSLPRLAARGNEANLLEPTMQIWKSSHPVRHPGNIRVKVNVTMKAKYLHFFPSLPEEWGWKGRVGVWVGEWGGGVGNQSREKMTGLIISAHTGQDSCFCCPEQACQRRRTK